MYFLRSKAQEVYRSMDQPDLKSELLEVNTYVTVLCYDVSPIYSLLEDICNYREPAPHMHVHSRAIIVSVCVCVCVCV